MNPCQPFSNAGKRLGTEDPRHLWPWIADAIGVLRPGLVFLENVSGHLRRGFDVVSADLADMGYRVAWGIVSAAEAGAPHLRKRLYIVAAAEDAYGTAGGERRLAAPGQTEGRWPWADAGGRGGMAPADALRKRLEIDTEFYRQAISREVRELWEYPDGYTGSNLPSVQDWKQFDEAIRRWELTIACDAPPATQLSPRGSWTLSPFLTEWMMGIPGRISSTPGLTRNEQIKLAGNGVVPQQAILAITELYDRLAESFASERAA